MPAMLTLATWLQRTAGEVYITLIKSGLSTLALTYFTSLNETVAHVTQMLHGL